MLDMCHIEMLKRSDLFDPILLQVIRHVVVARWQLRAFFYGDRTIDPSLLWPTHIFAESYSR